MGCGRSSLNSPTGTPARITDPDESKDGITFNENDENIVVRFKQITDKHEPMLGGESLINLEKQTLYNLVSSRLLDGTPKRYRLIYKGCTPNLLNNTVCSPFIGDTYVFNYVPPAVEMGSVRIRRKCDRNSTSEIQYEYPVEGFTVKSNLLPNEYEKF